MLDHVWDHFGPLLDHFWTVVGPCWDNCGPCWAILDHFLTCWTMFDHVGPGSLFLQPCRRAAALQTGHGLQPCRGAAACNVFRRCSPAEGPQPCRRASAGRSAGEIVRDTPMKLLGKSSWSSDPAQEIGRDTRSEPWEVLAWPMVAFRVIRLFNFCGKIVRDMPMQLCGKSFGVRIRPKKSRGTNQFSSRSEPRGVLPWPMAASWVFELCGELLQAINTRRTCTQGPHSGCLVVPACDSLNPDVQAHRMIHPGKSRFVLVCLCSSPTRKNMFAWFPPFPPFLRFFPLSLVSFFSRFPLTPSCVCVCARCACVCANN